MVNQCPLLQLVFCRKPGSDSEKIYKVHICLNMRLYICNLMFTPYSEVFSYVSLFIGVIFFSVCISVYICVLCVCMCTLTLPQSSRLFINFRCSIGNFNTSFCSICANVLFTYLLTVAQICNSHVCTKGKKKSTLTCDDKTFILQFRS